MLNCVSKTSLKSFGTDKLSTSYQTFLGCYYYYRVSYFLSWIKQDDPRSYTNDGLM